MKTSRPDFFSFSWIFLKIVVVYRNRAKFAIDEFCISTLYKLGWDGDTIILRDEFHEALTPHNLNVRSPRAGRPFQNEYRSYEECKAFFETQADAKWMQFTRKDGDAPNGGRTACWIVLGPWRNLFYKNVFLMFLTLSLLFRRDCIHLLGVRSTYKNSLVKSFERPKNSSRNPKNWINIYLANHSDCIPWTARHYCGIIRFWTTARSRAIFTICLEGVT